ncbi:hypothetical protein [Gracilimonas sp. BCB1]|uniref:hypothetical protein n=1 Tax=Gracilimonas sp. BCB1 TaxID=3152362 RepID=UPI0032D967EE
MLRTLLPFASALLIIIGSFTSPTQHPEFQFNTVNSVIGDISYEKEFGVQPDASASEETRIKTHLQYVIEILGNTETHHLNTEQAENRKHIITLLKEYIGTGEFPKNHHFENRRPVFIDRDGNLCAVGYLIAKTEGLKAAQRINRDHKFDYIKDIDPKHINSWLAENGLTQKEAAMIQPAYQSSITRNQNNIETEYAIGSSLLAGAQLGALSYSLLTDGSPSDIRKVSVFNSALGAASLTLGLVNLDNRYSETSSPAPEQPCICWTTTTTYTNKARTHLSIANIAVGTASLVYNSIRFFNAPQKQEPSKFNVSATQLYDPSSGQTAPALSLSMKF